MPCWWALLRAKRHCPGAVAVCMRKILARPGRGLVSMCVTWLWLVHIELIKAKLRRFCKVRCALVNISELKQRRRWGQRERQKSNKFRLLKQQLCITLFCTFLTRRFTAKTWTCLISRLSRTGTQDKTSFFFSSTLIHSFRIQLQKKLPTFDEKGRME